MIIKANLNLGGVTYQFESEEKDELEAFNHVITFTNPPTYCEICKSGNRDEFKLTTNRDKENNIYVNIKHKCGGKAKLGKHKAGGYFWHREFKQYVKKDQTQSEEVLD